VFQRPRQRRGRGSTITRRDDTISRHVSTVKPTPASAKTKGRRPIITLKPRSDRKYGKRLQTTGKTATPKADAKSNDEDSVVSHEPVARRRKTVKSSTDKVLSTPKEDDSETRYKSMQLSDFDVLAISGAHQNCLYRCMVLGLDDEMLRYYKLNRSGIKSTLDDKARTLRRDVCEFGRKELSTFTELTSTEGFQLVFDERHCHTITEAIDQIERQNVAGDTIDMLLLVNHLKVKLVIFRYTRTSKLFDYLCCFEPEEKYLETVKDELPLVIVKHNHSTNMVDEEGDHFELLIPKQLH
jgi:hypothetical protein